MRANLGCQRRLECKADLPETPFDLPVVLRYQLFEHLWQTAPTDREGELVSLGCNCFLLDIENVVRKGILRPSQSQETSVRPAQRGVSLPSLEWAGGGWGEDVAKRPGLADCLGAQCVATLEAGNFVIIRTQSLVFLCRGLTTSIASARNLASVGEIQKEIQAE
jgi:hypothetical protein